MTKLQRMLDSRDTDEFELRLLQGAAAERPAPEVVTALRTGLGLPTTALTRIALSTWKMTLLAMSMGALFGLRGTEPPRRVALTPTNSAASKPHVKVTAPASEVVADNAAAMATAESDVATPASAQPTEPATLDTSRARAPERARTNSGPDLREEIKLMDTARSAIRSQHAQAALDALDRYAARFPAGSFKQEAAVLKIQALALRGDTARAHSMAKQFIKNNPKSPYVDRASRIVGAAGRAAP
jgi:TolA-binding protein